MAKPNPMERKRGSEGDKRSLGGLYLGHY